MTGLSDNTPRSENKIDDKSDSSHNEEPPILFSSHWTVYAFAFSTIFSQHVFGWNFAFTGSSIGPFAIAFAVTGFAIANYVFCMLELCELYPFAGGDYAFVRVTFGRFPAFLIGCLNILQYTFMAFIAIAYAGNLLRYALQIDRAYTALFAIAFYVVISSALAFTFRGNSLPTVFVGFSLFLAILYLTFVFGTIPQMDPEKWLNNHDQDGVVPSFGLQFLSALDYTLVFTQGINTAFLLCDKTAEVREKKIHTCSTLL
jgi:amino acid transporter